MAFVDAEYGHVSLNARTAAAQLLHGYFERQVRRAPHAPAVECADATLTYLELDSYANRIAQALRRRGVSTGDFVGILLDKSPNLFAAILGVLKAGAAYVPLSSKFPAERVAGILDDCDAALVLSEDATWESFKAATQRRALLLDSEVDFVAQQPTT